MPRLVALCLFSCAFVMAQDPGMAAGFEHFYNLEYDQAIARFRHGIEEQPDNPNRRNCLALAILYREMFRSGALESELVTGNNPFLRRPKMNPSPEDQRAFAEAIGKTMELCQSRLRQNALDKDALYALGVAHGLRANYNFLVRKAWLDSLRDATAARRNHNKVTEIDPDFVDARLVQGIHDYVVGSLPLGYKLLGFLVGFHGDREGGIRTLQMVAAKGRLNRVDAEIVLSAIYRRERRSKEAIPLLGDLIRRYPRNFLLRFELAQMYSEGGDGRSALEVIRRIEELKLSQAPGYDRVPLEKIVYSRGNIQFWYGDWDRAIENMERVTARAADLDLNTGVLAWLRLGQLNDLKGRRQQAVAAYRRAAEYAPSSEAAREARGYLNSPYRRKKS